MNALITFQGSKPFVSTLDIAEGIGVKNRAIIQLAKRYQPQFEELGVLTFEMSKPPRNSKGGRPETYALLNEGQATFLLTLSKNTPAVVAFKLRLTKAFTALARQAIRKAELEWQQARSQGKVARKQETDTIKAFIEYAKGQGSKHPAFYYTNLTKATYKALFLVNGPMAGLREKLDPVQLGMLSTAEYVANQELQEGMEKGMHYRDIYTTARDRVGSLGGQIGQTKLLGA